MHTAHDSHATRLHRARRMGWKLVWFRLAAFFAVMGPGFITANVDNDPGGILTYSQAGAKFGYSLLWTLIPTTIALIVVQEMAARMGAVTGKGLSDLIREEFGLRITFFTMLVLGLADLGNIAAEFAGIASGMGIFGISKYLTVPVGAAVVWFVIVRGSYKPVERIFILLSLIYFTYPVSAFLAHPDWPEALRRTVIPEWDTESGLHRDDRGPDRHHRHAVDAVLPAGVDRGEGHHGETLLAFAVGRHHRLHRDRRDRVLHRGGVRGDAVPGGAPEYQRCGRSGAGAEAFRGQIRHAAVRASDWSMRRCSRRRFCRWPPPTTCARGWASNPAWTGSSARRRFSTGSTRS